MLHAIILRVLPSKCSPTTRVGPDVAAITDGGIDDRQARADDDFGSAAEKPDISIFREDVEVRCQSVISWATSGRLNDDMYVVRKKVLIVRDRAKANGGKINNDGWLLGRIGRTRCGFATTA